MKGTSSVLPRIAPSFCTSQSWRLGPPDLELELCKKCVFGDASHHAVSGVTWTLSLLIFARQPEVEKVAFVKFSWRFRFQNGWHKAVGSGYSPWNLPNLPSENSRMLTCWLAAESIKIFAQAMFVNNQQLSIICVTLFIYLSITIHYIYIYISY